MAIESRDLPFEHALQDPHRLCANHIEAMADRLSKSRDELDTTIREHVNLESVVALALSVLEGKQRGKRSVATQEAIDALKYGVVRV